MQITLPSGLESLEIFVELSRTVSGRDCLIAVDVHANDESIIAEPEGWPVYPPLGKSAKFVPLGDKSSLQSLTPLHIEAGKWNAVEISAIPWNGRADCVKRIYARGKISNSDMTYVWTGDNA